MFLNVSIILQNYNITLDVILEEGGELSQDYITTQKDKNFYIIVHKYYDGPYTIWKTKWELNIEIEDNEITMLEIPRYLGKAGGGLK